MTSELLPKGGRIEDYMLPIDRLLLGICAAEFRTDEKEALQEMLGNVIDWQELFGKAEMHGVLALIYKQLSKEPLASHIPAGESRKLHQYFVDQVAMSMYKFGELEKFLASLNRVGIQSVLLKGASLALDIYDDPALRPFSDIDLLIREEQWDTLRRHMLGEGFEPIGKKLVRLPPRLIQEDSLDHNINFVGKNGLMIECKLDPFDLGLSTGLSETFFSEASEIAIGRSAVLRAPLELVLLQLCVHVNRHGFTRLIWLLDICYFLRKYGASLDWDHLADTVKRERLQAPVFFTLEYVAQLAGCQVEKNVLKKMSPGWTQKRVWRLMWPPEELLTFNGAHEAGLVFRKNVLDKWLFWNLLLIGNNRNKFRYFLRKAFPSRQYLSEKYHYPRSQNYLVMFFRRLFSYVFAPSSLIIRSSDWMEPRKTLKNLYVDQKRAEQARVSVVIVTYDHLHKELFYSCLESLEKQSFTEFEVIVVENSAQPDSRLGGDSFSFSLKCVSLGGNFGPSYARNVGAEYAASDILLFLDDDALPHKELIEQHYRAYSKKEILGARGKILPLSPEVGWNSVAGISDLGDEEKPSMLSLEGNMSVRKSAFLEAGGFDTTLFGHEGIELTYRIAKDLEAAAGSMLYLPSAIIFHDYVDSIGDCIRTNFREGSSLRIIEELHADFPRFVDSYRRERQSRGAGAVLPMVAKGEFLEKIKLKIMSIVAKVSVKVGWYLGSPRYFDLHE